MRIKKKVLLLVGILSLLLMAGIFAYPYLTSTTFSPTPTSGSRIQIVDKSQAYDITYRYSTKLEKYLTDWGTWKPKNFSLDGKTYYTIKSITITLSDTDNGVLKYTNNKDNSIYASANAVVNSDKEVLDVALYLNPGLKKSYDIIDLETTLLFPLIQQLINPTHRGIMTDQQKLDTEVSLTKELASLHDLPFTISSKK